MKTIAATMAPDVAPSFKRAKNNNAGRERIRISPSAPKVFPARPAVVA